MLLFISKNITFSFENSGQPKLDPKESKANPKMTRTQTIYKSTRPDMNHGSGWIQLKSCCVGILNAELLDSMRN